MRPRRGHSESCRYQSNVVGRTTADRGDSSRDLTITTLAQDGPDLNSTTYGGAFITQYIFPIFDASESDVEALETIVFQANEVAPQ